MSPQPLHRPDRGRIETGREVPQVGLLALLDRSRVVPLGGAESGRAHTGPGLQVRGAAVGGVDPDPRRRQPVDALGALAGATAFGFRTVWINRVGVADEYLDLPPKAVLPDLTGLAALG